MKKIAIVCSGQGSQYIGQTKNLNNLEYYQKANEILGFDLLQICSDGPSEEINKTAITQPALLTHSWSLFNEFVAPYLDQIEIEFLLGHSVGEYAALTIAKSIQFENALKAVHLRGMAMQEAAPIGVGTMFAILKLESSQIESACDKASDSIHQVSIANNNSPGQIVISGHKEACSKAIEVLKQENGNIRAIELKVSAPFHSSLMKPAQDKMERFFTQIKINPNQIKYIPNFTALINPIGTDSAKIISNLLKQIPGQVQWTQSIQSIPNSIDTIIELGPGKTLKGLIKRINPNIKTYSFDLPEDRESFYKTIIN